VVISAIRLLGQELRPILIKPLLDSTMYRCDNIAPI